MIRSGIAVVGLGLIGLFGYYYFTDPSQRDSGEKAKSAAISVGDTVRDKGVASLVELRLKSKFGLEATRFVHAFYDNGRVLIYGVIPPQLTPETLVSEAQQVPGVREAEAVLGATPAFAIPAPSPAPAEPVPAAPTPPPATP